EDGIRDRNVTGVQTCALPILMPPASSHPNAGIDSASNNGLNAITHIHPIPIYRTEETHLGQLIQNALIRIPAIATAHTRIHSVEIGRASCREGGEACERTRAV